MGRDSIGQRDRKRGRGEGMEGERERDGETVKELETEKYRKSKN